MIDRLLLEEDEILRRIKINQKVHTRFVEEAKREESYGAPKGHQRFPHEFNPGYSPKK